MGSRTTSTKRGLSSRTEPEWSTYKEAQGVRAHLVYQAEEKRRGRKPKKGEGKRVKSRYNNQPDALTINDLTLLFISKFGAPFPPPTHLPDTHGANAPFNISTHATPLDA